MQILNYSRIKQEHKQYIKKSILWSNQRTTRIITITSVGIVASYKLPCRNACQESTAYIVVVFVVCKKKKSNKTQQAIPYSI